MAAAKRGGGGGGVMTGPRGGRYIMHGGNKHYLKAGESPSQAAVRVGAGVAPSARGRVLAQKARGKFNAGQERQMKKVEASYAKDVANNKATRQAGKEAARWSSSKEAARMREHGLPPVRTPAGMSEKQKMAHIKAANDKVLAEREAKKAGGGKVVNVGSGSAAAQAAAKAAAAEVKAEKKPAPVKKERPKFDAMADAEAHIAKLKAESAAKNAAKAPAAVGGYGGPPPSGEQTNKKLPNPDRLPLGKVDGSNRARDLAAAKAAQLRDGYGGDKAAQDRPRKEPDGGYAARAKADEIAARMQTGKGTPTGEALHAGARAKFGNPNSHQRAFEAHSLAAEYHAHMGDKKMQAEHQKQAGMHEEAIGAMMDRGQYVTKDNFYPKKKSK